jgi:hypothetical protein
MSIIDTFVKYNLQEFEYNDQIKSINQDFLCFKKNKKPYTCIIKINY